MMSQSKQMREALIYGNTHAIRVTDDIVAVNETMALEEPLNVELAERDVLISGLGYSYRRSRLDYRTRAAGELLASRMVTVIEPGSRTELVYRSKEAPPKEMTFYWGSASLLRGIPDGTKFEGHRYDCGLVYATRAPIRLAVEPDTFYAITAHTSSKQPVVVSSFYQAPVEDWSRLEQELSPGDHVAWDPALDADQSPVRLPHDFWLALRPDYTV